MTRILITRPIEDAGPLAEALHRRGLETLIEPLLTIAPIDTALPDLDGVQALLFTSANGVRAFAARTGRRDWPVYAVGDATATTAATAGFARVAGAGGDVQSLAGLVAGSADPAGGLLLHVAGTVTAGDLAGTLERHGFTVERLVLYEARTAAALSATTAAALAQGSIDAVVIFSPRTARTFVRLLAEAGLSDRCRTVTALCLSPAVAEAASTPLGTGALPWRALRVAERPEQESLLALVDAARES